MSIGIAFALLGQWFFFGGPLPYLKALYALGKIPTVKKYLFWSNFLNIACLISLLGAYFFPVVIGGMSPDVKFVKDLWKCWYLYWPVLLLPGLLEFSELRIDSFLKKYLLLAIFICALGWIQFFTGFPTKREIPAFEGYFHVQGLFGHHLSFASIMIFPFFMLLDETFKHLREKGNFWRILGGVIMVVALLGSFSRMLWIGLPLGLMLFFLVQLRGKRRWVSIFGCLIALGLFSQIPSVKNRLTHSMGTEERYTLWRANGEFFKMRPITGVGWHHNLALLEGYFRVNNPGEKNKFMGHAHNNFIEVSAALGLIGIFAFLGWNIYVLRLGAMASAGLFAAWVVFHFNGITQVNFWEAKVLHTMGLTLAFLLLKGVRREFTT